MKFRHTVISILGLGIAFGFMLYYVVMRQEYHIRPRPKVNNKVKLISDMRDVKNDKAVHLEQGQGQGHVINLRKESIRRHCAKLAQTQYWTSLVPSGRLWSYNGTNYCMTPKVGCTFWIRAFRFLSKDYIKTNREIRKPSDINRFQVHNTPLHNLTFVKIVEPRANLLLSSGMSFMFTRNPYTRLWSAFIDKMVLPDFWQSFAIDIANTVRQSNKEGKLSCVSDITFEEFLSYITRIPLRRLNEHWSPIHRMCSPCHVTFDVIGKQETFSADTAYIIGKYGLESIKEFTNATSRVKGEVEMLVEYNFGLMKRDRECYGKRVIANRLWLAFQQNGYIHESITFPQDKLTSKADPEKAFLDIVFHAIESHSSDMKRDLKTQKYSLMAKAYKSIPRRIINDLKKIFKYDFELFAYDPDPEFLN